MNNEIEVIDGVKGEWRTVTKKGDCVIGQRIRYTNGRFSYGFTNDRCASFRIRTYDKTDYKWFKGWQVQAFFPPPVKIKRKVAKVRIEERGPYFRFVLTVANFNPIFSVGMVSPKSATKSARRFCAAIGYECEIVN